MPSPFLEAVKASVSYGLLLGKMSKKKIGEERMFYFPDVFVSKCDSKLKLCGTEIL